LFRKSKSGKYRSKKEKREQGSRTPNIDFYKHNYSKAIAESQGKLCGEKGLRVGAERGKKQF